MSFYHANQTGRQKANARQIPSRQTVQKNVVQKKPVPDKTKGLPLLKEMPRASLIQKKPAPKATPDKVENLANEYLPEFKEVDVTFGRDQPSSRNIAPNIRNSPATSERSFLESARDKATPRR